MQLPKISTRSAPNAAAFAFRDLVALLAAVAILAALHLPSHANHRIATKRATCLANLQQLTRGWLLYTEDNQGRFTGNLDGDAARQLSNSNRTWAIGWLELHTSRADNTNWVALLHSQLGSYTRARDVYRCPADFSAGPIPGGGRELRVRSFSMNSYVGDRSQPYTAGYRQFRTLPDIVDLTPAQLFVFLDEREDSINDGAFFVEMAGYDPPAPNSYRIVDYPADRHNRAGNLAFADGHTETWRWQDLRTAPIHRTFPQLLNQPSPNNHDIARLQSASSRHRPPE
jgi:prepilin-type processing-associated H-X9-DG protein